MNDVAKLGGYYNMLEQFVQDYEIRQGEDAMPYHAAVAQGVRELLDVYRDAVLKIEECLSKTRLVSVLPLQKALAEFFELFPDLCGMITYIDSHQNELTANDIIELFERRASCGIPTVQGCAGRIAWHCTQVLCKQVYLWMIHGSLVDPSNDFFIHFDRYRPTVEYFQGTGRMQQIQLAWQAQAAEIVTSRLPTGMSPQLAKDILLVGQFHLILQSCGLNLTRNDDSRDLSTDFSKNVWNLLVTASNSSCGMHWSSIKGVIEAHRDILSKKIWNIMYSESDLSHKLDDIIGFLLHRRGDVYMELLQSPTIGCVFQRHPDPKKASSHASHAFHQAIFNAYEGISMPPPKNFVLCWFDSLDVVQGKIPPWHPSLAQGVFIPSFDEWDGLCLQCDLEWPMHLLFPMKLMRMYGSLWQLIFRVSRARQALKAAWLTLSKSRQRSNMVQKRALLSLHQQMYHFMGTYSAYLEKEVVEYGAKHIKAHVLSPTSSFVTVDESHTTFVLEMIQNACLDIRQVMTALESIFNQVIEFVEIVDHFCGSPQATLDREHIQKLSGSFLTKFNVIYALLQSSQLQAGRRGKSIHRWLLQLNGSNHFAEQNAMEQVKLFLPVESGDQDGGEESDNQDVCPE